MNRRSIERLTAGQRMTPRLAKALDQCDCADGMSSKDLQAALGLAMQTAFEYLNDLRRLGRATRVKLPGLSARYFARPAQARAWADSHAAELAAADVSAAAAVAAKVASKTARLSAKLARAEARAAPKPPPTPKPAKPQIPKIAKAVGPFVQAIARPTGEVIIPDHIVIQRAAPTPDTRFTVAPEQLTGWFSAYLPGIDPGTGKEWVAA